MQRRIDVMAAEGIEFITNTHVGVTSAGGKTGKMILTCGNSVRARPRRGIYLSRARARRAIISAMELSPRQYPRASSTRNIGTATSFLLKTST